jgi:hypothetical protein
MKSVIGKILIYPSRAQVSIFSYIHLFRAITSLRLSLPNTTQESSENEIRVSNRGDGTVQPSQIRDLSLQQIRASLFSEIHSSTLSHCSFHFSGQYTILNFILLSNTIAFPFIFIRFVKSMLDTLIDR